MLRKPAVRLLMALLLAALPIRAEAEPAIPASSAVEDDARVLLEGGRAQAAVDRLKAAREAGEFSAEAERLLGIAYFRAGNRVWAARTLARRVATAPEDCPARLWLALVRMDEAFPDQAADALDHPECGAGTGPDAVRWHLARARLARLKAEPDKDASALLQAKAQQSAWPSDLAALAAHLRALPAYLPDLSWRLDLSAGYTTNAWMSSLADDPSAAGLDGGGALAQVDAWFRVAPDLGAIVRPLAEIQFRGLGFLNTDAREASLLDIGGRAGVVVGRGLPRATLAYRTSFLVLARGDRYDPAPTLYSGLHRGEAEIEVTPGMYVFAGAGRRAFRESVRSRIEADVGAGGRVSIAKPVSLLWAASARVHRAGSAVWNAWGGTLLGAVVGRLPHGFLVRGSVSLGLDGYPDSGGTVGEAFFGTSRTRLDGTFRVGALAWSPSWSGVRVGLSYDFSDRESTASRYAFRDHRIALRLTWSGDTDVSLPAEAAGRSPVSPDWGAVSSDGAGEDRVQDLLRQDEQVQRSSSCVQ